MTNPIAATEANRSRAELHDREPVAATALQLLGELSATTTGAVTAGTIFQRCLDGCDFRRVRVASCRYEVVSFVGAYFWDAKLVDVEFVKCVLPQSDWLGGNLRRVRFVECDVSLADFSRAQRDDVVFDRCTGSPT